MSNTVPRPLRVDPDGTFDSRYWLRDDPLAAGPPGPQGPPGDIGETGPMGEAIRIRWTVATALDLPAINVDTGDGALVGTAGSYDLYVYTNDPPAWENVGPVAVGPQGPAGPQPPLAGNGVATTAARSDHNHDGVYSAASHVHSADAVTSGTFDSDRIPGLDASKVATGVLAPARVPGLDGSKIESGQIDASHIPPLDASKVTTGVFSTNRIPPLYAAAIQYGTLALARIPGLPANRTVSGTFDAARIPPLNANKIAEGTLNPSRIPAMSLSQLFPNNATVASGRLLRTAPGNEHNSIGTMPAGGIHDTGYRRTTDEGWAYVHVAGMGFGWAQTGGIS